MRFDVLEEGVEKPLGVKDHGSFGHGGGMRSRGVPADTIVVGSTLE
jgi:hypothetical protein